MSNIQGMDKLMHKLERLENPSKPVLKGMQNYRAFLSKRVKPYPPASQANLSPGINGYSWYVRNYGTRTITGKAYKTSQQLSKKWLFRTATLVNVVRLTIKNEADYAGYVQGDKQTWYHEARGWKRVDNEIEETLDDAVRFIGKEIKRELNK